MDGQLLDTYNVISVKSQFGSYNVFIDSKLCEYKIDEQSIIISDSRFEQLLARWNNKKIFITAKEENKSLEVCSQILSELADSNVTRSSDLVVIGGGVVQDIATLVASLYMRGISWTYFPTTKMSQMDSCIGGKSSINLLGKKNIVGNVYPPKAVHVDLDFEMTLDVGARASGYLEALKISFAAGANAFAEHLRLANYYLNFSSIAQVELTRLVLTQKKYFIETDEFDRGIRQLLNFGHTFGHALESASEFSLQHGIAIGIGMLMAIQHPDSKRDSLVSNLETAIWNILKFAGKESVMGLESIKEEEFLRAFRADKKHFGPSYSLILPSEQGLDKFTYEWNSQNTDLLRILIRQIQAGVKDEI